MPRTRGPRETELMIAVSTRLPVEIYKQLDKMAVENGNLSTSKMLQLIVTEAVTEIPQLPPKENE